VGLIFRRTKRIGDTDLNISKSGASPSRRVGRRLRVSSLGGGSVPDHARDVERFGRRR